jgi:hypothetical protein
VPINETVETAADVKEPDGTRCCDPSDPVGCAWNTGKFLLRSSCGIGALVFLFIGWYSIKPAPGPAPAHHAPHNHSNHTNPPPAPPTLLAAGVTEPGGERHTRRFLETVPVAELGVDTSTWEHPWPQLGWECLHTSNVSFALVEGYRSKPDNSSAGFGGHVVATAPQTVRNARAGGIANVDLYHFPDTAIDPAKQIQDTVDYFAAQNISFGKLWIDVEGAEYWNKSCSVNVAFLHALVAATQSALGHDRVGIYASLSQWTPIMCGDKSFGKVPLWYAHWDQNADFADWNEAAIGPFGGWETPTMKQYSGSKRVCGVNVDLDYRVAGM